ncbi:MAG: GntG family PLP-dependent aldolase [Nitrospiraceae bacterium]
MRRTDSNAPIDLRSDTITRPGSAMREAMAAAIVGDDVYGEDPTVNALQERAATLVDKKFALFVPSGTMANQLAIRVLTKPGDEVIVDSRSHIVRYEQGAAAALAGVQLFTIPTERGLLSPEQVEAAIRPKEPYSLPTGLISLENTHNSGGGSVYSLTALERIRRIAVAHGVPMHLDGARLFNAVVSAGVPATAYTRHFDTVSFCLSKGLGAPAGSLITTDREDLAVALRRYRRMYGGAMRQAGILAAAGLYALEHHITRLKDDHDRAKELARALRAIPSVRLDFARIETNIVIFELVDEPRSSNEIVGLLREQGVLISALGPATFRAVTHLDVSAADVARAAEILTRVIGRAGRA